MRKFLHSVCLWQKLWQLYKCTTEVALKWMKGIITWGIYNKMRMVTYFSSLKYTVTTICKWFVSCEFLKYFCVSWLVWWFSVCCCNSPWIFFFSLRIWFSFLIFGESSRKCYQVYLAVWDTWQHEVSMCHETYLSLTSYDSWTFS